MILPPCMRTAPSLKLAAPLACVLAALCLAIPGKADDPANSLPGMPAVLEPRNIYSEDAAGKLNPTVRGFPTRVYVPNSGSNSVNVIDPLKYKVIRHFRVGKQPQHVTPSYDLK